MSRNANQQRMNLLKKLYNEEMELTNPDVRYISDLHLSITNLENEIKYSLEAYMMVEKENWRKPVILNDILASRTNSS